MSNENGNYYTGHRTPFRDQQEAIPEHDPAWRTESSKGREPMDNSDYRTGQSVFASMTAVVVLVIVTGVMMHSCVDGVVKTAENQEKYYSRPFTLTDQQKGYAEFFRKHGSPQPEVMAVAVTQTKRPALMAAIAVKESNGDPAAVGDNGESKGAFQVQEKHWGPVSESPVQQALQAEKILEELVQASRGRHRQGLARYNGGTNPPTISHRYAVKVLKLAKEAKQWEL